MAPSTTVAKAELQSAMTGNQSNGPTRYPMTASVDHSLGSNGEVGVRSTVMKSSRLWNPSGRAKRSGRMSRNNSTTPPAAAIAITESRSRVRRAGKTLTRINVTALPITAGMIRMGRTTATAKKPNNQPPS